VLDVDVLQVVNYGNSAAALKRRLLASGRRERSFHTTSFVLCLRQAAASAINCLR
jgi:hypothetical protein